MNSLIPIIDLVIGNNEFIITDRMIIITTFLRHYYSLLLHHSSSLLHHYYIIIRSPPPRSVAVNTLGRESGDSWFETCLGVWYPRRRPCGVAINTLVDLINWLGKAQVFLGHYYSLLHCLHIHYYVIITSLLRHYYVIITSLLSHYYIIISH